MTSGPDDTNEDAVLPHPLMTDSAMMPTLVVNDVVTNIRRWLHFLVPGAILHGLPRIGKSQIARCLVYETETLLGVPIPAAYLTMSNPTKTTLPTLTANRLYIELLESLNSLSPNSGNTVRKRGRLLKLMIELTNAAGENRFLLVVDEGQWVTDDQYGFLMDLHNHLRDKGVNLMTILIGTPGLVATKDRFMREGQGHFVGRFMVAEHRLEGVNGLSAFKHICRVMDSMSEHPPRSGVSFTRHFAPEAFDNGWRLESQADMIWEAFYDVCRTMGSKPFSDLPMAPVIALLRMLLLILKDSGEPDPKIEPALVRSLIREQAWPWIYTHIKLTDQNGFDPGR